MRIGVLQNKISDCGAACLATISNWFGRSLSLAEARTLCKTDTKGTTFANIVKAANELGIECDALEGNFQQLVVGVKNREIQYPFIAYIINEKK